MTNPLEEASPSSLEELFARDPLQLRDVDIETIVRELRRMREKWQSGDKPKAVKGRKAAPLDPNVTLDDLGF